MRRTLILFVILCASVQAADLPELVQSERDFSKLAVEKGIRTAFLEYLSDDSVVFNNGPVNGKKFYEARPESPGILYWMPVVAELSVSGDLGYSTGPWEYRKASREEAPVAYGTFVSIWRKQPDGRLRVEVDLGCAYPSSSVPVSSLENVEIRRAEPGKSVSSLNPDREKALLMTADREFSSLSAAEGIQSAYARWATASFRLVRDGSEPLSAPNLVHEALGKVEGKLLWEPTACGIASGGDLGYTYGEATLTLASGSEKRDYLRVWKRQPDGAWKAVLDVISKRQ